MEWCWGGGGLRRISNRGDCLSDPRHTPRPSRDFFIVFFAFIWRISGKQPSVCGFEASPSASKRAPLSPLDSLLSNYPEDVSHDDHLIAMVTPASSPMCIRNGGREAVGIIIRAALYVRVRVRACAIASDECLEMRSCGFWSGTIIPRCHLIRSNVHVVMTAFNFAHIAQDFIH